MNLSYYPNPVTNALNIELPTGDNQIEVYNLTGMLLHQTTAAGGLFTHNMADYPAGMYLVTVMNGGKRAVLKVVK